MEILSFISALVSFVVVLLFMPWGIRYLRHIGLVVKDMQKKDKPLIPVSGGIIVLIGIVAGLMLFVFLRVFFIDSLYRFDETALVYLFAAMTTILIITLIGFFDDLLVKNNHESTAGLKQWQKPLLTLSAAVPLMVVSAGTTIMSVPFFSRVDFGILYPLVLIPLGVVGAANMVNMLAGYNGLEVGLGIISIGMLGVYAWYHERHLAMLFALVTLPALLVFWWYNWYPARIFPGDSLTYLLGAVLAVIAILGNLEKAALVVSLPFFIEFFLKLRSKFHAKSFGYLDKGKIHSFYTHVYSLPHLFARTGKFTEKQIVLCIYLFSFVCSLFVWVI